MRSAAAAGAAPFLAAVLIVTGCSASPAAGPPAATSSTTDDLAAFVRCMRSHGISDYPDPGPHDKDVLRTHPDLNPTDPRFHTALKACQSSTGPATFPVSAATPTTAAAAAADCDSVSTCYSPNRFLQAYGITGLHTQGIDGRGQTVVLPELAEPQFPLPTSDIRADLDQFDKLFRLPRANLQSVTTLAPTVQPWLANGEEVLDTEMVHAVAPAATIIEVPVSATSLNTAASAVTASRAVIQLGSTLGNVISISAAGQTGGERCDTPTQISQLHAALQAAESRHVTVVAASGDIGAVGEPCRVIDGLIGGTFTPTKQVNLPAADPLVLGVGGTTLTADPSGAYLTEQAWGLPYGDPGSHFQASGGGLSTVIPRPSYQTDIPTVTTGRGVPDVSADASPHTGMAIVTATAGGGYRITGSGGTSASAPLWAALIALADQYTGHPLGFVNPAIYRIAHSTAYHQAFHDVTRGNNSTSFPPTTINGYPATRGWDPVTGWGTPNASVLIPLLARP